MAHKNWTPAQDQVIRQNIGTRSYSEIAAMLCKGITRTDVWRRWCQIRSDDENRAESQSQASESLEQEGKVERETVGDNQENISSVHPEIRTVEDLLRHCKVDLTIWRVARSKVGIHEGFYRDRSFSEGKGSGKHWKRTHKKVQMYAVKVQLERIPEPVKRIDLFVQDVIAACAKVAPVYQPVSRRGKSSDQDYLLEVSIFDHHFGKLSWHPETGENYDLRIARDLYLDATAGLLDKVSDYPVSRILWIAGQDGLHTDNPQGTTTAGTPQHSDGRWQKSFLTAFQTHVAAIEMMRKRAEVECLMVPGNHDFNTTYFMGLLLAERFRKCSDVKVNNSQILYPRKYVHWGKNLLGFTHGNNEKHSDLPALMAKEAKDLWSKAEYHAWHVGHYHKRKETRFVAGDTYNGVEVRILPSLCAVDAWHALMGYTNGVKAAEAYLWGKEAGYEAHFAFNPDRARFAA